LAPWVGVAVLMRLLAAVAAVVLLTPAVAQAETPIVSRDVPLHAARTLASDSTPRFDMVGLHWRGSGSVEFRTRSVAGLWSAWNPAAPEAEDGPDHPVQTGWRIGNPYWTGASDGIAYRMRGRVTRLRAYFVWSEDDQLPARRLSIADSPPIITRAAWGADESIRRAPPRYADAVRFAVVHHTAGTNTYTRTQSAAIVRGIEIYHVKGNGWNDIGYNFLVDKYGQVFEGRFGGVDKNVIGAHAEGFNTGSFGVALLGTYTSVAPSAAAQTALENLLAWRLDVAHVDPLSMVTVASGGNPKYPAGVPVVLRAISGHRDTGPTTCPGNALYSRLGAIASEAAALGLPKLYAPSVTGQLGGPVEFRATLSTDLPWSLTVTDSLGVTVASGSGTGTDVDWTWDSSAAAPGRYAWTISTGSDLRPATGFIGAAPAALALKATSAKPGTISPNGDGVDDRATIAYTLTTPATVTATLLDTAGRRLATLFSGQRTAGKHSFSFTAEGVADGRYTIALDATNATKTVSVSLPLIVDRTFSNLSASPRAFSPNGDGRNDTIAVAFRLARPAHVRVDVKQSGRLVTPVSLADDAAGDQSVTWDGIAEEGRVRDGTYAGVVTVTTDLGTTAHSALFRVDTVAPVLRVISFRRRVFRLSERAVVHVTVGGKAYARSYKAGLFRFALRVAPRAYTINAEDLAGNVSRTLRSR
jgi:flagellar hook assembly protein FlgD